MGAATSVEQCLDEDLSTKPQHSSLVLCRILVITMTTHTCDKCGTKLDQNPLQVRIQFSHVELCKQCSEPLIEVLKEADLLQDELQRYGFIEPPMQAGAA